MLMNYEKKEKSFLFLIGLIPERLSHVAKRLLPDNGNNLFVSKTSKDGGVL